MSECKNVSKNAVPTRGQNTSMSKKIFFVLGGPGAGKGTQCQKLVEELNYAHFSAGDLLRAEVKSDSERGKVLQELMSEGKIVPSDITVELLLKAMDEREDAPGFLIDGFPRNIEQALIFEDKISLPTRVLSFEADEEEMTKRILARGATSGRADDNIETLKKRFATHREVCVPVIERYKEQKLVTVIHASKSIDDVYEQVKGVVTTKE